jgi:Fic family protein
MDGLIKSHQMMKESEVPAIIHAAVISYGFVFIHPFKDGNGRLSVKKRHISAF